MINRYKRGSVKSKEVEKFMKINRDCKEIIRLSKGFNEKNYCKFCKIFDETNIEIQGNQAIIKLR